MKELTYEEAEHVIHLKHQIMEFRDKLEKKRRHEHYILELFEIEQALTDIYYGVGTKEFGGCEHCA